MSFRIRMLIGTAPVYLILSERSNPKQSVLYGPRFSPRLPLGPGSGLPTWTALWVLGAGLSPVNFNQVHLSKTRILFGFGKVYFRLE